MKSSRERRGSRRGVSRQFAATVPQAQMCRFIPVFVVCQPAPRLRLARRARLKTAGRDPTNYSQRDHTASIDCERLPTPGRAKLVRERRFAGKKTARNRATQMHRRPRDWLKIEFERPEKTERKLARLDDPQQKQHDNDQENQSKPTAWIRSPTPAVRPCWNRTDKQKHKDDQQNRHIHNLLCKRRLLEAAEARANPSNRALAYWDVCFVSLVGCGTRNSPQDH